MDSMVAKKANERILKDNLIKGTWKLTYKLVNALQEQGFSGKLISSYTDPMTGKGRHLFSADLQFMPGYFIEKTVITFNPEQNPWHATLIDWLVGHPEVGIENDQCRLSQKYLTKKNDNPRIKLINLDHEDLVELQEEDYIDKVIGVLSLDGQAGVSLKKFRFILSALNLDYRYEKMISIPTKEKQKLRKRLKDFVRSSYKNAQKVNKILSDLDDAKLDYEIKELVRTEIFTISNGMFMYEGNPLGISKESVIKNFNNNPDFYAEITTMLYDTLKKGK